MPTGLTGGVDSEAMAPVLEKGVMYALLALAIAHPQADRRQSSPNSTARRSPDETVRPMRSGVRGHVPDSAHPEAMRSAPALDGPGAQPVAQQSSCKNKGNHENDRESGAHRETLARIARADVNCPASSGWRDS